MADDMVLQDQQEQEPTVTNIRPFSATSNTAASNISPNESGATQIAPSSTITTDNASPESKKEPTVTNIRPFQTVQGTEKQPPQGNVETPSPEKKGFGTGLYEQTIGGFTNLAKLTTNYYKKKFSQANDPVGYAKQIAKMGNPILMLRDAMNDKDHPLHQIATGLVAAHRQEIKRSDDLMQQAKDFASMGDWKNAALAAMQSTGHTVASIVPAVGPVAGQIGEDVADNPAYAAGEATGLISSILAPGMVTKGTRALVSPISEEVPGVMRPGVQTIAGEKVPVSAPQMRGEITPAGVEKPPLVTRIATKVGGTEKAAGEMIAKYTQPKAVEATYSNLTEKALDEIDNLRSVRAEPSIKTTAPAIKNPAEASSLMKQEAQKTYQPLDTAIESDHAAWEKEKLEWENIDNPKPEVRPKASPTTGQQTAGSKAVEAQRFKGEMQAWKDANEGWEAANPEPKSFAELQGDIQRANRTINSNSPAITSDMRSQAIKDLDTANKQMAEFTNKYSNLVNPGELQAANKLYSEAFKMSELSDKLKPIIKGTTGTQSSMIREPLHINVERLESIPNELNKEVGWGDGEFEKFMGPARMSNWNDVINALKNPLKGKASLLDSIPYVGKALGLLPDVVMNKLLFDPEFGRSILQMYKTGVFAARNTTKEALTVGRVGQFIGNQTQATHRYNPETGKVEPMNEGEEANPQ
jgi:hypothetical protein